MYKFLYVPKSCWSYFTVVKMIFWKLRFGGPTFVPTED